MYLSPCLHDNPSLQLVPKNISWFELEQPQDKLTQHVTIQTWHVRSKWHFSNRTISCECRRPPFAPVSCDRPTLTPGGVSLGLAAAMWRVQGGSWTVRDTSEHWCALSVEQWQDPLNQCCMFLAFNMFLFVDSCVYR